MATREARHQFAISDHDARRSMQHAQKVEAIAERRTRRRHSSLEFSESSEDSLVSFSDTSKLAAARLPKRRQKETEASSAGARHRSPMQKGTQRRASQRGPAAWKVKGSEAALGGHDLLPEELGETGQFDERYDLVPGHPGQNSAADLTASSIGEEGKRISTPATIAPPSREKRDNTPTTTSTAVPQREAMERRGDAAAEADQPRHSTTCRPCSTHPTSGAKRTKKTPSQGGSSAHSIRTSVDLLRRAVHRTIRSRVSKVQRDASDDPERASPLQTASQS